MPIIYDGRLEGLSDCLIGDFAQFLEAQPQPLPWAERVVHFRIKKRAAQPTITVTKRASIDGDPLGVLQKKRMPTW